MLASQRELGMLPHLLVPAMELGRSLMFSCEKIYSCQDTFLFILESFLVIFPNLFSHFI